MQSFMTEIHKLKSQQNVMPMSIYAKHITTICSKLFKNKINIKFPLNLDVHCLGYNFLDMQEKSNDHN